MFRHLTRAANGSILETTAGYRTAIGVLGLAMPILMIGASLFGVLTPPGFERSISAYYHTNMRNFFVGILWVIGVFLFFYNYTPGTVGAKSSVKAVQTGHADAWLGKAAGVTALVVAMFPTNHAGSRSVIGDIHVGAAFALFFCLALFPLKLFSESRAQPGLYKFIGWSMMGVLVLTLIWHLLNPETKPLLVFETILIGLFSWSWFAKGREQAKAPPETRFDTMPPAS